MSTRSRRSRLLWLGICLLIEPGGARSPAERALAALGAYRPWLARLTAEPRYAPCGAEPEAQPLGCGTDLPGAIAIRRWQCSPPPASGSPARRGPGGRPRRVLRRELRPRRRRRPCCGGRRSSNCCRHDELSIERAEGWLRQALATAPDRRPILSDLGAVELARAQRSGSSQALLRSIEYSQQALDEGAVAAAPRFNLALALSELGVVGAARRSGRRLLEREPRGPWAEEARRQLAALPAADGQAQGEETTRQLTTAAIGRDRESLLAAGRVNRQLTREWVEDDLLARWAAARLAARGRDGRRGARRSPGAGAGLDGSPRRSPAGGRRGGDRDGVAGAGASAPT